MPALPKRTTPAANPVPPHIAQMAADHAAAKATPEFKDSYDITYVDGLAQIRVSVDVKLSRNYQSCGLQAGMTFTTKAPMADDAIANGFRKLRAALTPQIAEASSTLDGL